MGMHHPVLVVITYIIGGELPGLICRFKEMHITQVEAVGLGIVGDPVLISGKCRFCLPNQGSGYNMFPAHCKSGKGMDRIIWWFFTFSSKYLPHFFPETVRRDTLHRER